MTDAPARLQHTRTRTALGGRSAVVGAVLAAVAAGLLASPAAAVASEVVLRAGAEPAAGGTTTWAYGRTGDVHLLCDWDGDGDATLALYRASDATWYVRQAAGGGAASLSFRYGRPGVGDRVLCGDWDGDGDDTPGLFRASDNTWHLRDSSSAGPATRSFRYGRPGSGDTPLVGDWNGDGRDTPGIFRSSDNTWYLRNSATAGRADTAFVYGRPGASDTPLVGDWDGDGDDTPGISRAADRSLHLRNRSTGGPADWSYAFGAAGDRPLSGDWDGDGRDEPALSRSTAPPPSRPGTYSAPLRTAVRQLPVAAESNAGYDRSLHFGDWTDADRDCHNTRQEVLIAESRVEPTFSSSSRGCTVVSGSWLSVYDGRTYTLASQVQIDHLVPVAEAWGSGARSWSASRRSAYYNDLGLPASLNAMSGSLNGSKGARGPEAWMPPANGCRYVEMWTAVKHRWRLSVDTAERDALVRHVDACPNTVLTVPRA